GRLLGAQVRLLERKPPSCLHSLHVLAAAITFAWSSFWTIVLWGICYLVFRKSWGFSAVNFETVGLDIVDHATAESPEYLQVDLEAHDHDDEKETAHGKGHFSAPIYATMGADGACVDAGGGSGHSAAGGHGHSHGAGGGSSILQSPTAAPGHLS